MKSLCSIAIAKEIVIVELPYRTLRYMRKLCVSMPRQLAH